MLNLLNNSVFRQYIYEQFCALGSIIHSGNSKWLCVVNKLHLIYQNKRLHILCEQVCPMVLLQQQVCQHIHHQYNVSFEVCFPVNSQIVWLHTDCMHACSVSCLFYIFAIFMATVLSFRQKSACMLIMTVCQKQN